MSPSLYSTLQFGLRGILYNRVRKKESTAKVLAQKTQKKVHLRRAASSPPFYSARRAKPRTLELKPGKSTLFVLTLAAGFLLPSILPSVGIDYPYFFIFAVVLFAWFLIKWDYLTRIDSRSNATEMVLGVAVIGADYAFNAVRGSTVGLVDFMVIFLASAVLVYGSKSLKSFWVPVVYGVVLLAGYQIENYLPNYVVLQDWLAEVMAGSMRALGIGAIVSGHLVSINLANGTPVALDIASDCTGLQGILAFGMLSTLALLDVKPRVSRLIPVFVVGFLGAFLINIVRLIVVFITFEFFGVSAGSTMHVYFGYLIFIVWVLAFWTMAFRYLGPPRGTLPQQPDTLAKVVPDSAVEPSLLLGRQSGSKSF